MLIILLSLWAKNRKDKENEKTIALKKSFFEVLVFSLILYFLMIGFMILFGIQSRPYIFILILSFIYFIRFKKLEKISKAENKLAACKIYEKVNILFILYILFVLLAIIGILISAVLSS